MKKAPRKEYPMFSGLLRYFPLALKEVSKVSFTGNEQHNAGEPLHWAREKSTDQLDCLVRHLTDHARGEVFDTDGERHLAKVIWRACAELELELEKDSRLTHEEVWETVYEGKVVRPPKIDFSIKKRKRS